MEEYKAVLADQFGRCKCRDQKLWTPAHAFVCASHKRQFNFRHTKIREATATVLRYHRCHVRTEITLPGFRDAKGKKLRSDIVVDSGLSGGVHHIDTTVTGSSMAIREGTVPKITAADIEEAKRVHERNKRLKEKKHYSVAPTEPNPAIPPTPVPVGDGGGQERKQEEGMWGEDEDDYLFNPGRAMAVRRLIHPQLAAAVTRKYGKYGFIDNCETIEGQFFPFPLSVGGTMAETTARIVRGIIRHPQHKHQSGFRTNPHAKASLNRYVFKRLSLALVLQTRMFFNDGIRGGIRY